LSLPLSVRGSDSSVTHPEGAQAYFSPKGGRIEAVVEAVDKARASVLVQAYSLASPPKAMPQSFGAKYVVDDPLAHRRGLPSHKAAINAYPVESWSFNSHLING